jgi:hypothetical protein
MKRWQIAAGIGMASVVGVALYKRFAPFSSSISPIPEGMKRKMVGVSWMDGCPLSLDELRLVKVRYRTYSGFSAVGKLIVAASAAPSLVEAFREMYGIGFPIQKIYPIDKYGAEDPVSMRNNNTSVFRCSPREKAAHDKRGTWSEHTRGQAIDINPLYNPFVTSGGSVQPIEGKPYVDRNLGLKGMVTPQVVDIFRKHGWKWGGNWSSSKDYQHFSMGGR